MGENWRYFERLSTTYYDLLERGKRKPSHVYIKEIPRINTVIHVIGREEEPSGKELSEIVKDNLYRLRSRAFPYEPEWW